MEPFHKSRLCSLGRENGLKSTVNDKNEINKYTIMLKYTAISL